MEHRHYSALFGVAMLALVGFFALFPQLKPDWVQIHTGKNRWEAAAAAHRAANGRGVSSRQTSWSSPAPTRTEAAFDRAELHLEREEWDEAIKEFSEVLRLEPKNADAYHARGIAHHSKQQLDEAISDYDAALRLQPKNAEAFLNRGKARFDLEQDALALADFDASLRLAPDVPDAYCLRGKIREEEGEYRLALYDYDLAIQRAPDDPTVLNCIAWLLATAPEAALRDGRKAVKMAVRAVKLEDSKEWDTIDTLAAAFAETGKFAEAVRSEEEALRLAPVEEHAELKARLELYQAKKAYRMAAKSP